MTHSFPTRRFSDRRSTADQIALGRQRAEQEGWPVVATFEDAAISGAAGIDANQRPGLNAMLALVEAGGIDQVLAESTDRISRHIAAAPNVRERIEFAGARLFTLFAGQITPMSTSEERRVGQEWVNKVRSRWEPVH